MRILTAAPAAAINRFLQDTAVALWASEWGRYRLSIETCGRSG